MNTINFNGLCLACLEYLKKAETACIWLEGWIQYFFDAVTNYPKFNSLKNSHLLPHNSLRQKSRSACLVSPPGVSQS